jgi:hypothetical protein
VRSTSARRILLGIGTGERYGREHDGKGKDTIRSISSGREVIFMTWTCAVKSIYASCTTQASLSALNVSRRSSL